MQTESTLDTKSYTVVETMCHSCVYLQVTLSQTYTPPPPPPSFSFWCVLTVDGLLCYCQLNCSRLGGHQFLKII